ncbi:MULTISPECIES: transporter substrate-binding domain-containing protein [Brevibacillus]|jgi:polar amino acid transport system substrate-binding protein|uniref:Amino acid ABC transporter substrate-binding protein, PAAT family n=2 Tax=Brevibacillus TaxID=55080 RepID=A0A1I3LQH4_9BACL|nr:MULTISPECIES: transporter substrate-binding domain-containing protein [Brevibacillus]MEC2131336.1 transporter substrate-binding domain-containing protein [Brevibacillus centrosporus]RNB72630.1 ABC transporter substrate-binding protein [Brevibacillus centrosporus]RNB83676.1 ABC transporter substrate-binding protein [Brevibacillus nitrificans]SFI87019.1 amino acid ABC transporter substrate-binding protein, PAAT family [Brevibacillus centrosporus]GED31547.1 basic amino acid ABC transporter sub
MKKWAFLWLALLLAIVTGCSQEAGGTVSGPSTIQKVLDKKKLVIGTSSGYFPFEMKDKDGKFVGYDMDLGTAIANALKVEVEFKDFTDFGGLIPALQTGDIDMVISGMTIRGDRALAVSFSDPYYSSGQVVMVPKKDTTTKSWQELDQAGKKIAVGQGSTGSLLAKQLFKNAQVMDFDGFTNAALAVKQGQADALIFDEPGVRVFEMMNSDSVRGVYEILSSENLGIALPLNDQATIQWVNSFLASYRNGLDDQASTTKWFKSNDWINQVQQQ